MRNALLSHSSLPVPNLGHPVDTGERFWREVPGVRPKTPEQGEGDSRQVPVAAPILSVHQGSLLAFRWEAEEPGWPGSPPPLAAA